MLLTKSNVVLRAVTILALCSLSLPVIARGLCGSEPGDYDGVSITLQGNVGALDVKDVVVISANPPNPGRVTHIDLLLEGVPHTLPNSDKATMNLPIKLRAGSRQLEMAGIPLKMGTNFTEVYVFDTAGHCGYGHADLPVRAFDQDFAIVIGVNVTAASPSQLMYARDDAYDIASHLINNLKLTPQNVWLLTDNRDEAAAKVPGARAIALSSPDVIGKAFDNIADNISELSALYIYFSGHQYVRESNAGDDHYFFMLPNSDTDDRSSSRWSWNSLVDSLERSTHLTRAVVIVDSCYSGSPGAVAVFDDQNSIKPVPGMKLITRMSTGHVKRKSLPDGVGLLASSSSDQPSYELRATKHHGAFTQSLLDVAANATAAHIHLSLLQAVDGIEAPAFDGAAKMAGVYVKTEYAAEQIPTHDRDPAWMKKVGTWVP